MSSVRRRPRKRHEQLALLDKTGLKKADNRKGKKRGGRPRKSLRGCAPHKKREAFDARSPLHVVLRVLPIFGLTLRRRAMYQAFRQATRAVMSWAEQARVVQLSIQRNHLHLIVEAADKDVLARFMQAFQISAAKHLNRAIGKEDGWALPTAMRVRRKDGKGVRRKGQVFTDRYHAKALTTPSQVRRALDYVLNNWRKHGEDADGPAKKWNVDPFSTGVLFDSWRERPGRPFTAPRGYEPLWTSAPATWLLKRGWQRAGTISYRGMPADFRMTETSSS